jgi:hypothetical protein
MSWAIHHAQSEELASQAEAALRKGDRDGALELYRLSAKEEEHALDALDPSKTRTLGITVVSAASLWFKANEWKQVERVACRRVSKNAVFGLNFCPVFGPANIAYSSYFYWI